MSSSAKKSHVVPKPDQLSLIKDPNSWDLYKIYIEKYMQSQDGSPIILSDWQDSECLNMFRYSRYLLNWGRGMSKTILLCLVSVFFALLGMRVCYCVPRVDELTQPMQYFNENPFVNHNPYKRTNDKSYIIEASSWFYVHDRPAIKITNIDDKGFNLSSGRFNVVIYDECALLMYYKLEVELLNKGRGLLRAMNYPHVIFASTPLIGSHFFTLYEKYPDHQKSWRNYQNTPNNFISNTPEKLAQLEEERHEAEEMGVLFAWDTENLAIPHTANGAAFKNIILQDIATFPSQEPNYEGWDFHGWQTGHIYVAFYYNQAQSPTDVYVLMEGAETYDEADTADESMAFLHNHPVHSLIANKRGESGGMINDPYVKAGRKYGMNSVSINGEQKHNLEANILNYKIHIPILPSLNNRILTPKFYDDISNAEWKDPNKFELHKETSGDKFRNHYLDAFANALPKSQNGGIYIPNKRLREGAGILAQEKRRDREGATSLFL